MDIEINWIQNIIRSCINILEYSEEEKTRIFSDHERRYLGFSDQSKKKIKDLLCTKFAVGDLIYALSIVVSYFEGSDMTKLLFDLITKNNKDAFLGIMYEYQLLIKAGRYYTELNRLHKKNIELLKEKFFIEYPYIHVKDRNTKRIVIITDQMLDLKVKHSPTRLVLNYIYILQEKLGYEVMLFACPCNRLLSEDVWYDAKFAISNLQFMTSKIEYVFLNTKITGYQIDMNEYVDKEYNMMFDMIYSWNPIFVLNMGLSNPIGELVGKFTSVVVRGMSSALPVSDAKYILKLDGNMEQKDVVLDKKKIYIPMKKLPVIFEKDDEEYSREEFGIASDAFCIAIVGSRLEAEIDHQFVKVMEKLLLQNEKIFFVLVGKTERIKSFFEKKIFKSRVYYLEACPFLGSFYRIMDLYLNPKRQGGGHSSLIALKEHLPVVTLNEGDVAYAVGPDFVVNDYHELIETVDKYVNDEEFYESQRKKITKILNNNSEDKLVEGIGELINQITEVIIKYDTVL